MKDVVKKYSLNCYDLIKEYSIKKIDTINVDFRSSYLTSFKQSVWGIVMTRYKY